MSDDSTTTATRRRPASAEAAPSGRSTGAGPRRAGGPRGPWRSVASWSRGHLGIALLSTLLLGVLETWGNRGEGYLSGWGDHFVLSTEGLSWAVPGAFENDWFMESSPQPHWFFDTVTYLGQASGHLSAAYVLFWAVGLLAFGTATALMAVAFAPRAAVAVAVGFTLLTSQTPWMVGGTGSLVIPQALPAVTSASMVYLVIAALVTNHRRLAAAVAVLVAVAHVQQGAVVVIILVVFTVVETVRTRRLDRLLTGSIVATVAVVAFGLVLRPVASNLGDFVEICDTVIPYHCAAHLWSRGEVLSTIGLVGLAVLSVAVVAGGARRAWLVTVGLAVTGYALGFAADALSIPVLGPLAQGVNVYRLGTVLLPFAIWGALWPFLALQWTRSGAVRLVLWAVALGLFFTSPYWMVGGATTDPVFLSALGLLTVVAYALRRWSRRLSHAFVSGLAVVLVGSLFVFVSAGTGGTVIGAPDFRFQKDQRLVEWGAAVRNAVPAGEVIVTSPRFEWVKLVTQRAVVADCKDVPYGGEPWQQWKQRLDDLGGYEQCIPPGSLLFDELTSDQLVDVADEYDSDFIGLDSGAVDASAGLVGKGWTPVVGTIDTRGIVIYERGA